MHSKEYNYQQTGKLKILITHKNLINSLRIDNSSDTYILTTTSAKIICCKIVIIDPTHVSHGNWNTAPTTTS